MKLFKIIISIVIASCFFSLGWHFAPRPIDAEPITIHDTIVIMDSFPAAMKIKEVEKIVQARLPPMSEGQELQCDSITAKSDSLDVAIPLSRYIFAKKGEYHIEAVGYAVSLPVVRVCKTQTTIIKPQIIRQQLAWDIAIEATIEQHQKTIGLIATRSIGRVNVSAFVRYDPQRDRAYVGASAKIPLFRSWR